MAVQSALTEAAASGSARRAIEEAQTIASTLDDHSLDVKHLAAAYSILSEWHDDDFAALRIDRLALVNVANCWSGSDRKLNQTAAAALPAVIDKIDQRRCRSASFFRRRVSV